MRKQNYVGFKKSETPGVSVKMERVLLASPPTQKEYGDRFFAFMGPFRTARGAKFYIKHGWNNPHIQTVSDAERIARQAA